MGELMRTVMKFLERFEQNPSKFGDLFPAKTEVIFRNLMFHMQQE
jgi:hypothetical protein